MPRFYPTFYLKLGEADVSSIYVQDSSNVWHPIISYDHFRVTKRLNQISEFEVTFQDVESTEKAYIKQQAKILFLSGTTTILKGKIQKVEYSTAYECTVVGYGMEADLLDKEYSNSTRNSDEPKRVTYTAVSAQTIAKELLSTNSDGSAPWDMSAASTGLFATDYGTLTMRFEFGNKLNCLAKLAESIDYDWWVSQNSKDYDIDYFNIASLKGTQSPVVKTYAITGDDANCMQTSQVKDVTNMANKIEFLGYADGINQIRTSTYAASTTYSTLSADITSISTTISLVDASDFDSSGTIRIAEEQITYTGKSGNDLTGCTRGANSTTKKAHKKSVYLEEYHAITAAESASPIGLYGKLENTMNDKTVINESTAELLASRELLDRMTPIIRIKIIPNEPLEDVAAVETGDKITITDAESDISSSYRITGINYEDEYGNLGMEIEASNRSLTFIEQMEKQREMAIANATYMQGATNIYGLSEKENCDATKPLNMRFFIPDEAVAINKVLIKFTTQKFRAYTTASEVNSAGTVIASAGDTANSVDVTSNAWTELVNITTANTDCDGVFLTFGADVVSIANQSDSYSGQFRYRIYDGTNYYPQSNSTALLMGGWITEDSHGHGSHTHGSGTYATLGWTEVDGGDHAHEILAANTDVSGTSGSATPSSATLDYDETNFCLSGIVTDYIPGNQKNKTFRLQVKWDGFPNTWDWVLNSSADYKTISRHTHNMDYEITEDTFPAGSPKVTVVAGAEGSESAVTGSPFSVSDGGEYSADITTAIKAVGAGNWCNIKFTPGSGSDHNRLRIESNAYVQIFIESK